MRYEMTALWSGTNIVVMDSFSQYRSEIIRVFNLYTTDSYDATMFVVYDDGTRVKIGEWFAE